MRRIADFLGRPIAAAFLASFATALLLGAKPPEQHFTERVVERVEVPGLREVIYRTVRVCDGDSVLKALNEVERGLARSGEGGHSNAAEGRVGLTGAGSAHADGDNAGAVSQFANASSGDAIIGQDLDLTNLCGTQVVTATNQVSDSKAISGDATAENEADLGVGDVTLPATSPTPSPEPVQEEETADESPPPSVRTVPPPTGSPSPSSTLVP